jgi:hypothetical protein
MPICYTLYALCFYVFFRNNIFPTNNLIFFRLIFYPISGIRYYFTGAAGDGTCSAVVSSGESGESGESGNSVPCSRETDKCCTSTVPAPSSSPYSIGCFQGCPYMPLSGNYMPICLYAYMPICLNAYMPIRLYAYMPICLYAYMPICYCIMYYVLSIKPTLLPPLQTEFPVVFRAVVRATQTHTYPP